MRPVGLLAIIAFLIACGSELAPEPSTSQVVNSPQALVQATAEAIPQRVTLAPTSEPPMPAPPGVIPFPTSPPATPTPVVTAAEVPAQRSAKVSRVIDGDTFDVEFEDGTTDTVRLLGIDTPETQLPNAPTEYGLITDTGCLRRWGDLTTQFASIMTWQTVELALDPVAGERGGIAVEYDKVPLLRHRRLAPDEF